MTVRQKNDARHTTGTRRSHNGEHKPAHTAVLPVAPISRLTMMNDSKPPPTPTPRVRFPMIPPLPSSLNLDKENQRQTSMRPFQRSEASPPIKDRVLSASASSTFSSSHSRSPHRSPSVFTLASSSPRIGITGIPTSSRLDRRVLRYGETMESLFVLDKECTDEHWKLARSLADGSAADNANVWRRILHLLAAKAQEKHNIACKGTVPLLVF